MHPSHNRSEPSRDLGRTESLSLGILSPRRVAARSMWARAGRENKLFGGPKPETTFACKQSYTDTSSHQATHDIAAAEDTVAAAVGTVAAADAVAAEDCTASAGASTAVGAASTVAAAEAAPVPGAAPVLGAVSQCARTPAHSPVAACVAAWPVTCLAAPHGPCSDVAAWRTTPTRLTRRGCDAVPPECGHCPPRFAAQCWPTPARG